MIRVIYVHHAGVGIGGAAISLSELIKAFPPGSIQPLVLCPAGRAFEFFQKQGFLVKEIPPVACLLSVPGAEFRGFRLLYLLKFIWECRCSGAIRASFSSFKADIIHLNERGLFWATREARSTGAKVVVHARIPAANRPSWLQQLSVKSLNRDADMVIAIDESVKRTLGPIKNCQVIYNPLHSQLLPPKPLTSESSRPGVVRITFLAVLLPSKGIWELFEAAKILRHRTNIKIQIAGINSRPRSFYDSMFGRICETLGFVQNVETRLRKAILDEELETTVSLLGFVQNTFKLLQESTDVLVFPSHLNGTGRSVFEAGVLGIPSVVCLEDKVEDIVVDGVTGLIVPNKDPIALAAAIDRLVADSGLRSRLGTAARQKYHNQFDPAAKAKDMLRCYMGLLVPKREDP